MKTDKYQQIPVIDGNITVRGVTAPIELWEPLGVCRANWGGMDEKDQPANVKGADGYAWAHVEILIVRAKDQLSETADPERIINRAVTIRFQDHATTELCAAMQSLGKINVSVPSNVNVWQHVKGESMLSNAAKALADAATALATR